MKRKIAFLLVLCLLLPMLLCGCGKEKELEPWTMPVVDSKPTPVPTAAPAFGGNGTAESYVWNDAESFNMSDPGVAADCIEESRTHSQCTALFPYNFLPSAIFAESHSVYDKLSLKKQNHDVMLDANDASLAEHAYVEFLYAPKSNKTENSITVMAELCSYQAAYDIYQSRLYPHVSFPDGAKPALSRYYFKDFVLFRYGDVRFAQVLKLTPTSYFSDTEARMADAAESGESYIPQRQILLTVSCGENMSDEEFIAAVSYLVQFSDGSEKPPVEEHKLPGKGEKGAA